MLKIFTKIYGPFDAKRCKDMIVDLATFITIITGSLTIYGYFAPDKAQTQLITIASRLDAITDSGLIVDLGDIGVDAHISRMYKEKDFNLTVRLVPMSKEIENISLAAYTGAGKILGEWSVNYINVGDYRTFEKKLPFKPSKLILCYTYHIDSENKIAMKITGTPPESVDKSFAEFPDLQKPIIMEKESSTNCNGLVSSSIT